MGEPVRELLRAAGVLYVDETPARTDGLLTYVHVAATEFLTAMHTGGRSKADIDAGQVLPGYTGTIVRDGYAGYVHLIDAHHSWCGAHLLRDLAAFHKADPDAQFWAAAMPTPSPTPTTGPRPPAPPPRPAMVTLAYQRGAVRVGVAAESVTTSSGMLSWPGLSRSTARSTGLRGR